MAVDVEACAVGAGATVKVVLDAAAALLAGEMTQT
jgi:hypothetical protein